MNDPHRLPIPATTEARWPGDATGPAAGRALGRTGLTRVMVLIVAGLGMASMTGLAWLVLKGPDNSDQESDSRTRVRRGPGHSVVVEIDNPSPDIVTVGWANQAKPLNLVSSVVGRPYERRSPHRRELNLIDRGATGVLGAVEPGSTHAGGCCPASRGGAG